MNKTIFRVTNFSNSFTGVCINELNDAFSIFFIQLGLEVGENNHVENVGWVRSKLMIVKVEAEKLGVLSEVGQKYKEGKKLGMSRRSKHTVGSGGVSQTADRNVPRSGTIGAESGGSVSTRSETFVERITPEEGLKSTISVMKFVSKSPEAKKDLNGLFAGVFDIQERLLDIKPDPDRRKTFESCLDLLREVGWIENCYIGAFDEQLAVVTLKSTTAIADAFGRSDEPMCQPICNLLETIGRKTFQKSVTVTEIECLAQGKTACKFEISPRQKKG